LFIDGQWQAAAEGGTRTIVCPADGAEVGTVAEATAQDTERAIAAARRAFDDGRWSSVPAPERGDLLLRVAARLRERKDEFARAESLDTGKRLVESEIDMDDIAACFTYFGKAAAEQAGRVVDAGDPTVVSKVVTEPVGVCGMITPWNYPLLQAAWKIAPAIAAGCTFVLKPAELTPHTAILMMQVLQEVGLPDGVANLVLGAGAEVGAPLSSSPDVDLVSFTGGVLTGRRIAAAAAPTVKKVALELGGKNPNVVFADADFDAAVDNALNAAFVHSGQVCSAGARLVVEEPIAERFVDELVRRAERIRLGGPFDEQAETGPLGPAREGARVRGARPRAGGARPHRRRALHRDVRRRVAGPRAGLLLPAHRDRPLHPRDGLRARRGLRPHRHGRDLPHRGRGRRDRQRHDLRPRRGRVDRGRRPRPPRGGPAAPRHDLDQRLPPLPAAGGVGRDEAVGRRARARPHRPGRVPGAQARLPEHGPRRDRLVRRTLTRARPPGVVARTTTTPARP
jgi:betaine-aldehyde dehydrogenase